jgi:hypothetical protein
MDDASLDYIHFWLETDGRLNDFLRVHIREEKQALDIMVLKLAFLVSINVK